MPPTFRLGERPANRNICSRSPRVKISEQIGNGAKRWRWCNFKARRLGGLPDFDVRFTPESGHVQCNSACPLCADCVAKLFAALRSRNNRIRLNGALNQCCAFAFVLESILLILVVKIVLQHNLLKADIDRRELRHPAEIN